MEDFGRWIMEDLGRSLEDPRSTRAVCCSVIGEAQVGACRRVKCFTGAWIRISQMLTDAFLQGRFVFCFCLLFFFVRPAEAGGRKRKRTRAGGSKQKQAKPLEANSTRKRPRHTSIRFAAPVSPFVPVALVEPRGSELRATAALNYDLPRSCKILRE